jgi:predicted phosphodiesterase
MRHIVIGDIHGCIEELKVLLEKINLKDDDKIISLGDLVHKGPDSKGVVQFLRKLSSTHDVYVVKGNHEERQLRWISAEKRFKDFGSPNKMQHTDGYDLICLDEEDISFLNSFHIWRKFTSGGKDFTCVHGGVLPSMKVLPNKDKYRAMSRKDKSYYDLMMRCRYVTPEGDMVFLGDEKDEDFFWADLYDGRFGRIFFGHNPFMKEQPVQWEHATGLDLGAVYGNVLAAAIVEEGVVTYETVKAFNAYDMPLWLSNREPRREDK